jgi:tRNA A-37 threonylcarbamoyl transferase component Bud32
MNDVPVVFYKICREVAKAHRKGIIHHDIKMGNVLISSVGEGLRSVEIQLIDWNLASFYSQGY